MNHLDHHIAHLLEDHDCVIVPDFGGFVANYASARVNPVSHRFDPPYRKISFNKHLIHNDGLLAAYVSRKEDEAYDKALQDVKQYALFLKKGLQEDQKVSINKVGLLYQHPDGTLHFEQVRNPAFFKEATGLDSFFAKRLTSNRATSDPIVSIKRAENKPPTVPVEEVPRKEQAKVIPIENAPPSPDEASAPAGSSKVTPQRDSERKRRYWPVAAALIGIPLIGYAIWLSLSSPLFKQGEQQFQWGDLNPLSATVTGYEARETPFQLHAPDMSESILIEDRKETIVLRLENNPDKTLVVRLIKPTKTTSKNNAAALRFHIVGGCFSMKRNAEGLVERYQSQGNNARLIDEKGGLYRVSVQSFASRKEAKQHLAIVRKEISGAWLLYK